MPVPVDALAVFCEVASAFGLSVNASKTKFMVVGIDVSAEDCVEIIINDSEVEYVQSFMYLGSVITPDARSCSDVKRRVAQASSVFGSLRRVFLDEHLPLSTKRHLYMACVLTVLLYGAECWTPLKKDSTSFDRFHHRCIRTVLGVTRQRQWDDHLTNCEIRHRWGDVVLPSQKVARRRLDWLGHIARKNDSRWPKLIWPFAEGQASMRSSQEMAGCCGLRTEGYGHHSLVCPGKGQTAVAGMCTATIARTAPTTSKFGMPGLPPPVSSTMRHNPTQVPP